MRDGGGQPSDGTSEAYDCLFRANYDDLVRYAVRRVGPDAATDVAAQVFLVAWRRRGDMPTGSERLWLFGVAANLIANERRGTARWNRLVRRASTEPAPASREVLDPGETVSTSMQVRAVLATLPFAEQEALRLTEWEQLDIAEAAEVVGCSRATFRVRLHRARRRFASRLREVDPEISQPAVYVAPAPPTAREQDVIA